MSPGVQASSSFPDSSALLSRQGGQSFSSFREAGIVLLAILLLALLLMAATYLCHRFITNRQSPRRDSLQPRRRRRRHHSHATLARSGGLPPKRSDDPVTLNPSP
jgi:hypothetical protein